MRLTQHFTLIVFFAAPLSVRAAELNGTVRDPQGGLVVNAEVRLHRQDTAAVHRTATNAEGRYRFDRLPDGAYLLEVQKDSFRSATQPLRIEDRGTADVTLELAGVSQTVIVTASAAPQQADETAKPVTVIPAEEIRDRNEYALSESLRTVAGVLITNGGGPGQNTSIRIRGLRADAAGILVDGMRFRDATTLQGDASSFVASMNLVAPDRVEVLRGSASSLYGTNAVGGVVNVVTQEGGGPLHGQLQGEAGNLGLIRGRGDVGGGAWQDRLKYSAGFLHLDVRDGVDGNDAYRSTGGQGFVRYQAAPSMSASFRLWASDDVVRLNVSPSTTGIPAANFPAAGSIPAIALAPAGVAAINAGGVPSYGGATYVPGRDDPDSRRWGRFFSTAFTFRHTLTPRAGWQATYQRVHTTRDFENGPLGGGFQPAASNESEYNGDIDTIDARATALLSPWMSVTGGYEFERESYFDRQNNNLPAPRLVAVQTRVSQRAHAGYFAAQLGLADRRLQISFSGRGQTFRLSRPEFQLSGVANNYATAPLRAPKNALTGDVSIAYLIAKSNTKLRVHTGNAYRAPALYERFGGGFSANPTTGVVNYTAYGDPRLASDRYNSVDAGVDQYLFASRLRVSATWFYSRIVSLSAFDFSGLIRSDTDPFQRTQGYFNGSGGISRGFELSAEARPVRTLTLSGAYTFTNSALDRDLSVTGFFRAFGTPRHLATLVATRQWTSRLSTTIDVFRSGNYYTPFFAGTRSRAFDFPGFTKVDATASYKVWEGERGAARIYGKVDNLFAERYYQNGWLASRATFVAGLGYGF